MPEPDRPFFRPLPAGGRVALAVEYAGGRYRGWQRQGRPGVPSVQATLEAVLTRIAAAPIGLACAGRTDAGVHASHQVVHFDNPSDRTEKAFVFGANANLPADISVQWARAVSQEFHARFSASARRYRYVILNRPLRSAHLAGQVTHWAQPLDAELMHREAQCLLGEQDFSAFRAAGCQSRSPMRNLQRIAVQRRGEWVVIDLQANAFLHHMVRNIAGVLMAVGGGVAAPGWTAQVLAGRDRRLGGVTAPPHGLYLVDVLYASHWGLPAARPGPAWLAPLLSS